MTKITPDKALENLLKQARALSKSLANFDETPRCGFSNEKAVRDFTAISGNLLKELRKFREKISPVELGTISISLGRSDSIAKFFAFSFLGREKRSLNQIEANPFFGSGIYAIYYHGTSVPVYQRISSTETPIYVGKADPVRANAESVEEQGQTLYRRLREHARSISMTNLSLEDFHFRAATIQSGMQPAVEEFLIRLFHPIWNAQIKICYGIGKHGDSAKTRANKRSPWDTMHPGRPWATATKEDQVPRELIEEQISHHFTGHPPLADKNEILRILQLDS